MKLHLPETFLTQAQSIIREGPKQNPRRLRKKSAKAQKKIGKGSKKNRRRLNNFFLSLSRENSKPVSILI